VNAAPSHAPRIGCAGWSIPTEATAHFPAGSSHLQRYAQVFDAVEINSSFYRTHRPATYRRWGETVPESFRFSLKVPRTITHEARLVNCVDLLREFLAGARELGPHLGCLLLQLPPRLAWDGPTARAFLAQLREQYDGPVACEPRHTSWFRGEVEHELATFAVARVAADPALSLRARVPGGDRRLRYLRLHGAPRVYYDNYPDPVLERVARYLQHATRRTECWCIFDNTAHGHATGNALSLRARLGASRRPP